MPRAEGGKKLSGLSAHGSREKPLVSVVTVVFNGAAHVEEAIRAVASQTYHNIEHVIVDGGWTDDTVDILRRYNDTLAYWVSEPDAGLYDAMNKGVALVSDPESYIMFANADDSLAANDVIEKVISLSGGEDLVYGKMILTDGQISGVAGREVDLGDLARQTLCHPA